MLSLERHRRIADRLGGEAALSIHELIAEIERLRELMELPDVSALIGAKEVADILNINPKNMCQEDAVFSGALCPYWKAADVACGNDKGIH